MLIPFSFTPAREDHTDPPLNLARATGENLSAPSCFNGAQHTTNRLMGLRDSGVIVTPRVIRRESSKDGAKLQLLGRCVGDKEMHNVGTHSMES